jgi:transcriptional regulator with XRE-family HTH domain
MEARGKQPVKEHFATEEAPFHFTDSGLDNVYLVGIKYFTDEQGKIVAEIPAVKQLMRFIARDLLYSRNPLNGQEVRFLRKRLGQKAVDFAALLRLDASTLSRIENDKQEASDQVDALVRACYLIGCDDPMLKEHADRLMALLREAMDRHQHKRIVMRIDENQEWTDVPAAA